MKTLSCAKIKDSQLMGVRVAFSSGSMKGDFKIRNSVTIFYEQ